MGTTIPIDQIAGFKKEKTVTKAAWDIQPYVYACVFSSLCIIVGLIWDISWHMTIGRDGLLSPPHDVIYLGAILSGLFSAYHVLKTTFWGSAIEKRASVKFWGIFYGSLGSLFCLWGAIAMLTSAPFDNWWHGTYGLDVVILSPPHALLAMGVMAIQFGALVAVLSSSHTTGNINDKMHNWLFVVASGILVISSFFLFSEYLNRANSHSALTYQISAILYPSLLIAIARATRMRWAATAAAAVYMVILLLMLWILPLFPAVPRLGPVLNHVDHYQPFNFPLLLVVPAFFIDLVFNKPAFKSPFVRVLIASLLFLLVFFIVQWYFGGFLLTSPLARSWFFGSYSWYFGADPNWEYRYSFRPGYETIGFDLVKGLLIAGLLAIFSGLAGYKVGGWMKKIQR